MSKFKLDFNDKRVLIGVIIAVIVVILLIGFLIGLIIWQGRQPDVPPVTDPPVTGPDVDPGVGTKPPSPGKEPSSNVVIDGWAELTIPPNKKKVNTQFENSIKNEGAYNLTFELRLLDPTKPEGYEVLYTSGLVPAGQGIYEMEMTRGLDAGEYAAIVHVQPYRVSDNTKTSNNANLAITLIVK